MADLMNFVFIWMDVASEWTFYLGFMRIIQSCIRFFFCPVEVVNWLEAWTYFFSVWIARKSLLTSVLFSIMERWKNIDRHSDRIGRNFVEWEETKIEKVSNDIFIPFIKLTRYKTSSSFLHAKDPENRAKHFAYQRVLMDVQSVDRGSVNSKLVAHILANAQCGSMNKQTDPIKHPTYPRI